MTITEKQQVIFRKENDLPKIWIYFLPFFYTYVLLFLPRLVALGKSEEKGKWYSRSLENLIGGYKFKKGRKEGRKEGQPVIYFKNIIVSGEAYI